ncbi:MAG: pilus assembly protein [Chloroflexota bacterium]|nr:pilus assembly protein [Chloroflexota bacterium]
MVLPIFLLLVLGTLEFGLAFDHNLTLEYATREGARTGSALANGGGPITCSPASAASLTVDNNVVAAVERVLASEGSPIDLAQVSEIRIYKVTSANTNGNEVAGLVNRWTYTPGAGPIVGGTALDFSPDLAMQGWPACQRFNGQPNPDSIGVSVRYSYDLQTSLGALLSVVDFEMRDRTVMSLNPTGK